MLKGPDAAANHLRLEEVAPVGSAENLSQSFPVVLQDNTALPPGTARQLDLPVTLTVGATLIDVEASPTGAERGHGDDRPSGRDGPVGGRLTQSLYPGHRAEGGAAGPVA